MSEVSKVGAVNEVLVEQGEKAELVKAGTVVLAKANLNKGMPRAYVPMPDNRRVSIYQSTLKTGEFMYTVHYRVPGVKGRLKKSFMNLYAAEAWIRNEMDEHIAAALKNEVVLRGEDAVVYKRVLRLLKSKAWALDRFVEDRVWAENVLVGHDFRRAIQFFIDRGLAVGGPHTVKELVAEYLKKEYSSPVSKKHNREVAQQFSNWLHAEFRRDRVLLSELTVEVLTKWTYGRKTIKAYASQKVARVFAITFLNHAKKALRWLPYGEPTVAELVRRPIELKAERTPITIFEPELLRELIEHLWAKRDEHPKFGTALCVVLFGAFLGERAWEQTRTKWEYIDLARGEIVLPWHVTKTGRERGMPVPPNLVAFLKAMGPKPPGAFVVERKWKNVASEEWRRSGHTWPHNGLRHSFGSCWYALIKDENTLSSYMGNSPVMLRRYYLRRRTIEQAEAHFGIYPPGYSGPVVSGAALIAALRGLPYAPSVPVVGAVMPRVA